MESPFDIKAEFETLLLLPSRPLHNATDGINMHAKTFQSEEQSEEEEEERVPSLVGANSHSPISQPTAKPASGREGMKG